MITLKNESTKQYYFVKDNVIFNISSTNSSGDKCAHEVGGGVNDESLPSINVKLIQGTKVKSDDDYYLDVLISDGDKCKEMVGDEIKSFEKTDHKTESGITFCEYYISLCEEQIKETIINNKNKDYSYYSEHLNELGIPEWMFKNSNESDTYYKVSSSETSEEIEGIDFTEELYDSLKEKGVIELSLKAANDKAKTFNYIVKNTTLDIEKL